MSPTRSATRPFATGALALALSVALGGAALILAGDRRRGATVALGLASVLALVALSIKLLLVAGAPEVRGRPVEPGPGAGVGDGAGANRSSLRIVTCARAAECRAVRPQSG